MTSHHRVSVMRAVAGLTVLAMAMSALLRVSPARATANGGERVGPAIVTSLLRLA